MSIPFTRYVRPDGDPRPGSFDVPEPVERMAERLIEAGVLFDVEVLQTGEVSMTAMLDDECLAIKVVPNRVGVALAVEHLVLAASLATTGGGA